MTNDTILFFPHNMHHEDVFQKISGELLLNYGLKAKFLVSDESISKPGRTNIHRGALDFTCLSSDIAYELGRIKRTYPLFNISRAILTDRNVNFFPKFFNLNRLDFIDKQSELVALFLFFEDYLDNNSINFIISELIIGMPDAILYEVAKSKGVKYISMRSSRVFKGFIFSDPYTELPVGFDIKNAEESYKGSKNVYSNVLSYISSHKDLTTPHMLPHYMIRTSQTLKVFNVRYIKKFFLYILDKRINFFRSNFSENSIFRRVFYRLIKYKNTVVTYHLYKKYFYTDDIGKKERKYLLFPLQYQPEATSSVRSFPFIDQIALIKAISTHLPDDTYLYVKEHMGNEGYRSIEDYRELYYLPNVLLLDRRSNVQTLMNSSIGVVTLNSTLGIEALCAGKPVAVFGHGFWTEISCVVRCNTAKCIENFVKNIEINTEKTVLSEGKIHNYLSNYATHIKDGVFLSETKNFDTLENRKLLANEIINLMKGYV